MTVKHSNNGVVDGLQFHFDIRNKKSFRGKPTVNLITDALMDSTRYSTNAFSVGGTGNITWSSVEKALKWQLTAYSAWGAYLYFNPQIDGTLDILSQYTISFEWKTENNAIFSDSVYFYVLVQADGQNSVINRTLTESSVKQENGWWLFEYTFTPSNTGTAAFNKIQISDRGANVSTLYVRNMQLEKSSFRTPVVQGARLTGLNDLTNKCQVTESGLIYAANNIVQFSSSSAYILIQPQRSSMAVTVTAMVKLNGHGNWNNFVNNGWSANGWLLYASVDRWYWGVGNSSGGQNNTSWPHNNTSEWTYLTGVYDGSEVRLYVNGVKRQSVLFTTNTLRTIENVIVNASMTVATEKKIDILKIYDRPLTDSEAALDFESVRWRYGI